MRTWLVVLLSLAACVARAADPYPNKPIRIIITVVPGGGADITARAIGQKLTEAWGQQVIVDNRPGGNGSVGMSIAANANPDGYTLVEGTIGPVAVNPSLYSKLPYDPVNDFAPVARAVSALNVLVVHPSLPVKSVKELVALAKARPAELNYASGGNGSPQHLPMEMLKSATGINIVHVPYKGLGPAFSDVLGGQVPMMFAGMSNVVPHLRTGRIRALAIGNPQRSAALPDVPTVAESGIPGYRYAAWTGFLAPSGVSKEIVGKLHGDIVHALGLADVRERLGVLGFELIGSTPEQFAAQIESDLMRLAKVVKEAGIRVEQ